jgi:hypothetical protein
MRSKKFLRTSPNTAKEWAGGPLPGKADGVATIRLCLPTTYIYRDPNDNTVFDWGHLTNEQSDHLVATVLDGITGLDDALFEENNWDMPFPFPGSSANA